MNSPQIETFEEFHNIRIDAELKEELTKIQSFNAEYYQFYEFFNLSKRDYFIVETYFAEKFVVLLIEARVDEKEIEDGDFDFATKQFSSEKIEDVYNSVTDKTDLLIYYIGFGESCGGRDIFILNGPDAGHIAYDHHISHVELKSGDHRFKYISYLEHDRPRTIFDLIKK